MLLDIRGSARSAFDRDGELVLLEQDGTGAEPLVTEPEMAAEGVRMLVPPLADDLPEPLEGLRPSDADLVFELERGLTVGYRVFWECAL